VLLVAAQPAPAQTESVFHNFTNTPDGGYPESKLVLDTAGNVYGTTLYGGVHGRGSVFMITPAGTETVLYSFTGGADGNVPVAGLVRDTKTGNLFGTTLYGGASGNGTVFQVTPSGTETVLYSFKGGTDGFNPYSSLVRAGTTIYGTTNNGGAYGYGTVFKLTAAGKETVLHSFNSAFPTLDGAYPYAGLVLKSGILYGTTRYGGASNLGTVFSITQQGAETVLYSFKGGSTDGGYTYASVVFDTSGNLYGTNYSGGIANAGTVFKLTPGGVETVLHSFARDGADGINPQASLIFHSGNFYGTTLQGGPANVGTVFKITPAGTETVLYKFTGGADGGSPYAGLVFGKNNTFYSTTYQGGASNYGTVFKLVP
jgi:uncharacterized repeat protein (TIGR03803 family)